MAILVDYNQIFIANLMKQPEIHIRGTADEDLDRHMVLNSLRSYRTKFKNKYGELIICCDNNKNWRKAVFPEYKAHRKKGREQSSLDWNNIFQSLNKIRSELRNVFPYLVVEVEGAEADDVIAILTEILMKEQNLILSGDKDFGQLQKFDNVTQFNPMRKLFVEVEDPDKFLKEQILRGDKGDGVPNFLSPDDTFVSGNRQVPLSKAKVSKWSEMEPEIFCNYEMSVGYHRNKQMVQLSSDIIPDNVSIDILNCWKEFEPNDRASMMPYFVENKLRMLMERIDEF